ncbi:MAG: PKD domain-containing protein [bacterium]|nr:PKD domain-containing protein [bacterium]
MKGFKKTAIWVLVISMFLVLAPGLADAFVAVSIEAPASVNLGDTFTAKVKIDESQDPVNNLVMVRFKLTFDPAVLQFSTSSCADGSIDPISTRVGSLISRVSSSYTVRRVNCDNGAGWVIVIIRHPGNPPTWPPVTGTGPLAEVDFKVVGSPQSKLTLVNFSGIPETECIDLADSNLQPIPVSCSHVFPATVSVCMPPVANFTVSDTTPCPSVAINFTDSSSGTNINSWLWNFGDGNTSSDSDTSHAYSASGTYTVTLTVTGDCGTDSETKTGYITVISPPSADFTASDTTPCVGSAVSFTDNSTGAVSWSWDFDNNGIPDTTVQNPSYTYPAAGNYTVTLTVTGLCTSDSETKNNYITVGAAPVAGFTASTTTPCSGSAVSFTNNSTGSITSWWWDFGDGSPGSTAQSPPHTYTNTGTYTVKLTVTGDCGTDTKTRTNYITVVLAPSADFTAGDTTPCVGAAVSFTDHSTGNISGWSWNFGDGSPGSTAQNPLYTYTTAGIYTVILTVTGPCGSNTKTKTNYITAGIKAGFSATPLTACAGSTVNFTDASIGDITSRLWDFGDGDTGTATNPSHTYTDTGTFTVTLTVTGPCGSNPETKTNYITVVPNVAITADFNASSTTPCLTSAVTFTDSSAGTITSWSWNFGDGGVSSDSNPSHAYTTTGIYPVSLTVTGPCGTDAEIKTNYITAGIVADFSASSTTLCLTSAVTFTDSSTGTITSWSWDLNGDGNPDTTARNPSHTYTTAGIYTVSLTVSGPCGSDTKTKTNYITAGIAADFRADSTSLCLGTTVSFTDVSTGTISSRWWNFGDGGISSDSNPTHAYTTGGTYPVSLTVTGPCGSDTETKTNYITVTVPPAADFTVSSTTPCAGSGVTFTDTSTGSITSWAWAFGDGDTSALRNPTHSYTAAGIYTVSLTVIGHCGTNTKTKTDYITAASSPAANFEAGTTISCVGSGIGFTDKSSGSITSWLWTFGDGQGSTSRHPAHAYSAAGTYTVSLTVTGSCGSDTKTKSNYITVRAVPAADFTVSSATPCVGSGVTFTDTSTGSITSRLWNFGDGDTSPATNPSHTYTTAGSYTVSLTVTGSCGTDTETKTNYITVVLSPTADFTANTTIPCAGAAVVFTDHSIGTIASWLWYFGDGDTGTAQNPSHTYLTADTYTVSLVISGPCGSDTETKTNFTVIAGVTAGFSVSPTNPCPAQSITFTDNSTGPVTSRLWNFGDGQTSAAPNPAHTYSAAGAYTVSLAVSGNCNTDTKTGTNYITVGSPPSANFTVNNTNPCVASSITFTDNSTGPITSWSWNFGDGRTGSDQNPSYTYSAAGTYTVTLTVTAPCGTDVETMTDYITVVSSPAADFAAGDTSPCAGSEVVFTDNSTGTITSWSWDFGDGSAGTARNPSHTYLTADTYTVSLTITGPCGSDTETKISYITVLPSLSANFTLSSTDPCSGSIVTFTDISTGDIISWFWDFGDGASSQDQNPSHTYTTTGSYPVSLTVTGNCGTDTRTQYLTVDAVKAGFTAMPASGYQPLAVTFTDLSTGNVTSWLWDFGDGQTSTTQQPSHTYTTADTYTVSLTVSGPCGSDTKTRPDYITVTIPIGPSPPANLTAKPISTSQIELSWQDNSTDEIGFKIERKTVGEAYRQIAVLGANTTIYLDEGLSPETTYFYRLRAYNLPADSAYSNEASAATLGPFRVRINAPAAVTEGDTFKATLYVTSVADLKSVYFLPDFDPELFRFISAAPGEALAPLNPTMTANRYLLIPNPNSFTGSGALVEMKFKAIGSAPAKGKIGLADLDLGNVAGELIVVPEPVIPAVVEIELRIFDIPAPPGNLNPEVISTSRIRLSWSDNSDNESGFEIYRKTDGGGYGRIYTTSDNETIYEDEGLSKEAIYCYQVRAYNSDGESDWSKEACVSTRDIAPQSPANLTARPVSSRRIDLEWTDNSDNESGFKIERREGSGALVQITTVAANVTTYQDNALAPETTYYYRVRAYNYVGDSGYSKQAQAATPPLFILEVKAPETVAPEGEFEATIELSWVQGLKTVFLIVDYNNNILQLLSLEAGSLISSANPGISILNNRFQAVLGKEVTGGGELVRMRFKAIGYSGGSGQIRLSAYFFGDSSGKEITPDSITPDMVFITGPLISPPGNLVAWPVSSNQIELAWSDRSDNETSFDIERKIKGGAWFLLKTVPANTANYSDLSGLKPNTTYYYRVRASNSGGSSDYSNEAQAVTWDVSPSPPTNLTAAALTNNVINLTWQDNSNNETGFKIERRKEGESWFLAGDVPPNTRTYTDSWVFEPDTTYYYRLRAYNLMGHSAYSNEAGAVTSDIPPAPPAGLIAVALSSSSINITWRDNSDNETGFRIERKQWRDYSYSGIATVPANTKTYSDSGLKPNTNYVYRVRAYNQVGDSFYSNEAPAATWDIPPSPPTGLKATVAESGLAGQAGLAVDLEWQDKSDNETGFKIERKKAGESYSLTGTVPAGTKTYSDLNINPATTYYYRVRAYNQFGDSGYSNEVEVNIPALGTVVKVVAPADVQAGGTFEVSVEITEIEDLNTVEFNLVFDSLVFKVQEPPRPGGLTASATPRGNLLSPGNYRVTINVPGLAGVDGAGSLAKIDLKSIGNSSAAGKLELSGFMLTNTSVRIIPVDAVLPAQVNVIGTISPPYNLRAEARSTNLIYLSWQAISDDKTGFKIERKINAGDYVRIKELPAAVTTYLDTEVNPENTYCYQVRAYNLYATSAPSDEACAATGDLLPAAPDDLEATALPGAQIRLDWEDNSNNELGFKIERRQKGEADYSLVKIIPTANTTTYTDPGLASKTTYYYRIWAYNLDGSSGYSNVADATTPDIPPAAPTDLKGSEITGSSIMVSWSDNSDNETGFRIERRTGAADDFDTIALVMAGTEIYLDSGLASETTYCYRLFAYNKIGDSSYAEACFTTSASPPIAPANLTVKAVSSSRINLAWQDNSLDEAGFKIERRTGAVGAYTEIAAIPARPGTGLVDYQDIGLEEETTYYYRVRAWNEAGGDSPYSNSAAATTPLSPLPLPLKIAFASGEGNEYDIYLMNEDGSSRGAIVTSPGIDWEPNISPDGTRLVFSSDRDGDLEIYVINIDGTGLRQLTNNPSRNREPSFFPDGGRIVFVSDGMLYTMDMATGISQSVTLGIENVSHPCISPDETQIAFSAGGNIYMIGIDGLGLKQVTAGPSDDQQPCFSPAGDRIAFSSNREGDYEIYTMAIDGADLKQVTNNEFDDVSPAFSPDENYSRIGFSSDRNGNRDIYLVNGEEERLTGEAIQDIQPSLGVGSVLAAPSELSLNARSRTEACLSWQDNSGEETGFVIRRVQDGVTTETTVSADATTYCDPGLRTGLSYCYQVKAKGEQGDSPYSNQACFPQCCLTPEPPDDLKFSSLSDTVAWLSWRDNSYFETGFVIERKVDKGDYTTLIQVGAGVTTYREEDILPNNYYCYRIRAINEVGLSDPSNEICTCCPPDFPANLSVRIGVEREIILTWTDNSDNETGFEIQRRISGGSYSWITTLPANTVTYTDTNLEPGIYRYRIRAVNICGYSNYSESGDVEVPVEKKEAAVVAFPNPFYAGTDAAGITFRSGLLTGGGRIRIYSQTGQLIKTLAGEGGDIVWEGLKNDGGREVASGIYIYVVDTPKGMAEGKLSVIR